VGNRSGGFIGAGAERRAPSLVQGCADIFDDGKSLKTGGTGK